MKIDKIDKQTINLISEQMSKDLIKHPLFMFFCSNISKREGFIKDYFSYYLPKWVKEDVLFSNEKGSALVTLTDPKNFEYKYKGVNAYKMKKHSYSSTVFVHRENLETICEILLPDSRDSLVMTIYTGSLATVREVLDTVKEAMDYALQNNAILAYDTFSRRYLAPLESQGFTTAYNKQFLNTRFAETVMLYNM